MKTYRNGQIVEGVITGIQPYGAFVSIDDATSGLIHISEISDGYVRDIGLYVSEGERVLVKIIEVSDEADQLKLSLKALNYGSRKDRTNKNYRRPLVPKAEIGFATLETQLPIWEAERVAQMIHVDLSHALLKESVTAYQEDVTRLHSVLENKEGKGSEYTGWLSFATDFSTDELNRIKQAAASIQAQSQILFVCGIGGSYLGARAVIDMLDGPYLEDQPLRVVYVGNTFSSTQLARVLQLIDRYDVSCNVISKSGTTTETALAFRFIRQAMEAKYGDAAASRIYATTDAKGGLLKPLADANGYETFVIPDDVGGRFSVITPVGLLPISAAGYDIEAFMNGAKQAEFDLNTPDLALNPAYTYAVVRRILEKQGKSVETLVTYEPHMVMLAEWWKQLFGESEGKEDKGLMPNSVNFSTDLHSVGQFIQEGSKIQFETVIAVKKPMIDLIIPQDEANLDQLNYLADKSMDWVNKMAFEGTLEAHEVSGNVPNIIITMDEIQEFNIGYLMVFFFRSLAMSVYLLDVNPFDQPGVEVYKKNMFRLLGKE